MVKSVTWKIGGEAGFGIMSAGNVLAKTLTRLGYHIFVTNEYPSLIRGGHNLITLRVSNEKFYSMNKDLHILVALNAQTVKIHKDELSDGSIVVFDPSDYEYKSTDFTKQVKLIELPMTSMLRELHADVVFRNTIALGATVALLGVEESALGNVLSDIFGRKGQEVVDYNVKVAKLGYDTIVNKYSELKDFNLPKIEKNGETLVINGSEALGVGAVKAGLQFAAIYPMTPINALITFLADHAKELGIVYKQPEDEVAGINMAMGASMMGARSMVATSGGGFGLMVEGTSLSGMQELPVVIDLGMRVGPATGMPTWTEQSELKFVISCGHGEFPRIILAPGDGHECHDMAIEAFELADRFQIPVFILTDKYLNESHWEAPLSELEKPVTVNRGKLVFDDTGDSDYKRYNLNTEDGVNLRSVPGTKQGIYYANSYEHNELGFSTEDPEVRKNMVDKRNKKFTSILNISRLPKVYGDTNSKRVILSWGSTYGPVLDAVNIYNTNNSTKTLKYLHFNWLYPLNEEKLTEVLNGSEKLVNVENNSTGQLGQLIREITGIKVSDSVLQYSGRPFFPEDLVKEFERIFK